MWFRNIQLYRLPENWPITGDVLQEKISARPFQPCGSQDMVSRGWGQPAEDGRFVISVRSHHLVALKVQSRLLPGSVVTEQAQRDAEHIERIQGFKPGRKQMKEIKEAVLQRLLPQAFTRTTRTFAWIDPTGGWLAIDASSPAAAEVVLEALRDALDSLPVKMVRTKLSPVSVMTGWLAANEATGSFTLDQDCELEAVTDSHATVRYTRHALDGKDVQDHLAAGKLPTRLALTFDDRVSFVLTEKGAIKRLAFLDVIKEQADKDAESADMQLEADFTLMSGELSRLITALIQALGGEDEEVI